jgi:hypothetical protein
MKKEIIICGKTFNSGYSEFESHDEVNAWYDAVQTSGLIKSTNFKGDPYNWASWIQIELDGMLIHINPPNAKNGDNNWYSYHKDFGFYTTIH